MGHIVTDRVTDGWKKLDVAKDRLEKDLPELAIGNLQEAVELLYKSVESMGVVQDFHDNNGFEVKAKINTLSKFTVEQELELLEELKQLFYEMKESIEEEIKERLLESDGDIYTTPSNNFPKIRLYEF